MDLPDKIYVEISGKKFLEESLNEHPGAIPKRDTGEVALKLNDKNMASLSWMTFLEPRIIGSDL